MQTLFSFLFAALALPLVAYIGEFAYALYRLCYPNTVLPPWFMMSTLLATHWESIAPWLPIYFIMLVLTFALSFATATDKRA